MLYAAIADVLFWGFGQGDVTIFTDDEQVVTLKVGFSSDVGLVVVPFIDDEPLEDGVGFLPWRAE